MISGLSCVMSRRPRTGWGGLGWAGLAWAVSDLVLPARPSNGLSTWWLLFLWTVYRLSLTSSCSCFSRLHNYFYSYCIYSSIYYIMIYLFLTLSHFLLYFFSSFSPSLFFSLFLLRLLFFLFLNVLNQSINYVHNRCVCVCVCD